MFQGFHPPSDVKRLPLRGLSQASLAQDYDDDLSQSSQSSYHSANESQSQNPDDFDASQFSIDSQDNLQFDGSQQFSQRSNHNDEYVVYPPSGRETPMPSASQVSAGYDFPASQASDFSMLSASNAGTITGAASMPASQASDFSMMSSSEADLPDLRPITRAELQATMYDFTQRMIPQIVEGIVAERFRDFNAQMESLRADLRRLSERVTKVEREVAE